MLFIAVSAMSLCVSDGWGVAGRGWSVVRKARAKYRPYMNARVKFTPETFWVYIYISIYIYIYIYWFTFPALVLVRGTCWKETSKMWLVNPWFSVPLNKNLWTDRTHSVRLAYGEVQGVLWPATTSTFLPFRKPLVWNPWIHKSSVMVTPNYLRRIRISKTSLYRQ